MTSSRSFRLLAAVSAVVLSILAVWMMAVSSHVPERDDDVTPTRDHAARDAATEPDDSVTLPSREPANIDPGGVETSATPDSASLPLAVIRTGQIVGPNRLPIAGADVALQQTSGTLYERVETIAETTTGGDGRFSLPATAVENGLLLVRAESFADREVQLPPGTPDDSRGSSSHLDIGVIELEIGIVLRGTLVDAESNAPLEGATIRVKAKESLSLTGVGPSQGLLRPSDRAATSDRRGEFTIDGLSRRVYRVVIEASNHATYQVDVAGHAITGKPEIVARYALLPLRKSAHGMVVDREGNGLPNVRVIAHWDGDKHGHQHIEATSDATGEFTLEPLADGPYRAVIRSRDGWIQAAEKTFFAGETSIQLILYHGGTIVASLSLADGTAAPGGRVDVVAVSPRGDDAKSVGQARRRDDGLFETPPLAAGTYRLVGKSSGGASEESDLIELSESETVGPVHLKLSAGGTVSGRVVRRSGRSIEGAAVVLTPPDFDPTSPSTNPLFLNGVQGKRAQTNHDGDYTLAHIVPGTYSLFVVAADGNQRVVEGILVEEGVTTDLAEVTLGGGGTIRGVALNTDGSPLRSVSITAKGENVDTVVRCTTTAEGAFQFTGLDDGSYRVELEPASFFDSFRFRAETECRVVDAGVADVVIQMTRRGG